MKPPAERLTVCGAEEGRMKTSSAFIVLKKADIFKPDCVSKAVPVTIRTRLPAEGLEGLEGRFLSEIQRKNKTRKNPLPGPVWLLVWLLEEMAEKMKFQKWQRKNPEPIESTCSGLLELIAGFEPATSSLPRILDLALTFSSLLRLVPLSPYFPTCTGFCLF